MSPLDAVLVDFVFNPVLFHPTFDVMWHAMIFLSFDHLSQACVTGDNPSFLHAVHLCRDSGSSLWEERQLVPETCVHNREIYCIRNLPSRSKERAQQDS